MHRPPQDPPGCAACSPGTRSRLLSAAARDFARKGFYGTGLRGVAERAGTSLGSVRYHFGGKAELYLAVLQDRLGSLRAVVAASPRGQDALARTLFALIHALVADPDAGRLFLRAALDYPGAAADEITALVEDLAAIVAGSSDKACPDGAYAHALAAECLCAAATNVLFFAKMGLTPHVDPDSLTLHILDLVKAREGP